MLQRRIIIRIAVCRTTADMLGLDPRFWLGLFGRSYASTTITAQRSGGTRMYRYLAGAVAAAFLLSGAPASAQDKLTVFWGKGFYKAEDDALFAAVKKFEE